MFAERSFGHEIDTFYVPPARRSLQLFCSRDKWNGFSKNKSSESEKRIFASHVQRTSRTSRSKKRTSKSYFLDFRFRKKLLISQTDSELNFIRVLFFFSDLITTLRNRRHKVFYLLGFANLTIHLWGRGDPNCIPSCRNELFLWLPLQNIKEKTCSRLLTAALPPKSMPWRPAMRFFAFLAPPPSFFVTRAIV